jgi:polysaccharide pyruvyl transferase WcaK-like protein
MRLHSMILAIAHHIPFIALSYGQKTDALCDALQWKYRIHTQNLSAEMLQTMLENIETHREQCIEELKKYHHEQQSLYIENFPKLCK